MFCNRSLSLENIKSYGFDMDYTLAMYIVWDPPPLLLLTQMQSPAFDVLVYDLTIQRLIKLGAARSAHAPLSTLLQATRRTLPPSSSTPSFPSAASSWTSSTAI